MYFRISAPDPGHSEIRWELGDLHHLRSVGELLKDPQSKWEFFFGVSVGLTLLKLENEARVLENHQQSKTNCCMRGKANHVWRKKWGKKALENIKVKQGLCLLNGGEF